MYLTAAKYISIPRRRVAYSTVGIAAMIDNRLDRKYAFHVSVPAFGVAGGGDAVMDLHIALGLFSGTP
jgi:hypothetical protein